jgi:glycosyltransferase involved in cell wall biosynthesis
VFVGGTDSDIKKFKAEAKDMNNVLILGHRPHREISKYLAAADVLVLPNSAKKKISRSYTSPMKLFEYMASGRPIVASGIPSITEVLNEQNAILVESDDAAALADGIKRALSDNNLADAISKRAYNEAKQYDWNVRARRIMDFLNE